MSRYELTILLKPEAKLEDIKKLVDAQGIKVETEKPLGLKNLVYPIAGVKSANFYQLVGEFETEKIRDLTEKLKLKSDVLRFLLVSAKAEVPDITIEVAKIPKAKIEPAMAEKPLEIEKPSVAKAMESKPKKVPPPPRVKAEKPSVEKDIESEEERLRQLEEKLSDILKE